MAGVEVIESKTAGASLVGSVATASPVKAKIVHVTGEEPVAPHLALPFVWRMAEAEVLQRIEDLEANAVKPIG